VRSWAKSTKSGPLPSSFCATQVFAPARRAYLADSPTGGTILSSPSPLRNRTAPFFRRDSRSSPQQPSRHFLRACRASCVPLEYRMTVGGATSEYKRQGRLALLIPLRHFRKPEPSPSRERKKSCAVGGMGEELHRNHALRRRHGASRAGSLETVGPARDSVGVRSVHRGASKGRASTQSTPCRNQIPPRHYSWVRPHELARVNLYVALL
jgi:hypothetical protein